MRFSPLFEKDANQNSRTLSPESPEKSRTGDIMRIGANRSLSNDVQKQIHYGKIRSSAEMCETKSTSRTYYGVRLVEGSYKTNTHTTANEWYQKHWLDCPCFENHWAIYTWTFLSSTPRIIEIKKRPFRSHEEHSWLAASTLVCSPWHIRPLPPLGFHSSSTPLSFFQIQNRL
jgi:hypothetical protein